MLQKLQSNPKKFDREVLEYLKLRLYKEILKMDHTEITDKEAQLGYQLSLDPAIMKKNDKPANKPKRIIKKV